MNEEFEKQLMIQVRGQLLINWLSSLKELIEIPFESYSRFHRKIFSILVVELMNDGLKYASLQKNMYTKKGSQFLIEFFSIICDGVSKFKDEISDDEYIYLYHLRNCAGHIFPVGYDNVDLEGNVKTKRRAKFQTKVGKQEMSLDDLETILSRISLKFRCDDRVFLKKIYQLSLECLLPMLKKLEECQRKRLRL